MERRSEPRYPLKTPYEACLRLSSGDEVDALVYDLSNVGAFLATDEPLAPQTRIEVAIVSPVGERVWMDAVVARVSQSIETSRGQRPAGLGIVLLAETPAQRDFLQQTVMSHLTDEARRLAS